MSDLPTQLNPSTGGGAARLVCLGLAWAFLFSLALALADSSPIEEIAEEVPPEVSTNVPLTIPNPDAMYGHLRNGITAATTTVQRLEAAFQMVDFLADAVAWRTERERYLMARDYLLAIADLGPEGQMRFGVAHHMLELARKTRDMELLVRGEQLIRAQELPDPIPFDLLALETDALAELGELETALQRTQEMGRRPESARHPWPYLLRVARGIRMALEHERILDFLWNSRGTDDALRDRNVLLAELAERATDLSHCGMTALEAEGLYLQAFVAAQRHEVDAEINLLQEAISKGLTPIRPQATMRLADVYRDEGRDMEQAALLGLMVGKAEFQEYVERELQQRLRFPASESVARQLLLSVDRLMEIRDEESPPMTELFLAAGRAASWQGWLDASETYLDLAEELTLDRSLLAESMVIRAEIARIRDERVKMLQYYKEAINLFPGHRHEADIRFILLEEMAAHPYSEADLVGGIMGVVTRLPQDPRGLGGLLMVAQRLENLDLFALAENYYRLGVLVSSMQQFSDDQGQTALALLGQARMMVAQGKDAEADSLLRVINTNPRWSHIWHESGPIWTAIAFREEQFREGIRRWRQTCGPPGGVLLPYLFELLVPDLSEWSVQVESVTPRKPGVIPPYLVQTAVDAAMAQFLEKDDYEGVEILLAKVDQDEEWNSRIPVREYRTQLLERMAQQQSLDSTFEWLGRHTSLTSAVPEGDIPPLLEWKQNVDEITRRVRSLRP